MGRLIFFLLVGLGGAAILVSLGIWQVQRLAWKEGVIAEINARITAVPAAIPAAPDPEQDAYLPVRITGTMGRDHLRVLVSQKDVGAGYRIISAFRTEEGDVMLDRGFVRTDEADIETPNAPIEVTGNLQWPDETDSFTPDPDRDGNIWFARDVALMAEALDTRPVLIVASAVSQDDPSLTPLPVDTTRIPNDHLQYAITWFSLAVVWLAMTFFFLRTRARPTES